MTIRVFTCQAAKRGRSGLYMAGFVDDDPDAGFKWQIVCAADFAGMQKTAATIAKDIGGPIGTPPTEMQAVIMAIVRLWEQQP